MTFTSMPKANPTRRSNERASKARSPVASGLGRLRPRARLLRTIGAELISSEIVAIIELVRNSFDADSTRVELRFTTPHLRDQASLAIWDDGHGMTRELLLGPWLEPATDFKAEGGKGAFAGIRSPAGRRRLGSKGVGRFAAQRLGNHLRVRTRATGSATEIEAEFDWAVLDASEGYLDEVEIPWSEHHADRLFEGTALEINGLRDDWDPERFDRLRLGLSRLVGPGFAEEQFEIYLVIDGVEEAIRPFIDTVKPMYSLTGDVAAGGHCIMHYQDASMEEPEEWHRQLTWPSHGLVVGPFSFSVNAWDLDRPALTLYLEQIGSPLGLRDFRRTIRDHSGVSLYRDGFRILPYGEADNDWLRLDRRRVNNPTVRLSNNQLLGWIQLSAEANPELRDQTNREGLVTNDAYHHLQAAVLDLLSYLENRRFGSRRKVEQVFAQGLDKPDPAAWLPGMDSPTEPEPTPAPNRPELKSTGTETRRRSQVEQSASALDELAAEGILKGAAYLELNHAVEQLRTELDLATAELNGLDGDSDALRSLRTSLRRSFDALRGADKALSAIRPPADAGVARQNTTSLGDLVRHAVHLFDRIFTELDVIAEVTLDGRDWKVADASLKGLVAVFRGVREELVVNSSKRRIALIASDGNLQIEVEPAIGFVSVEAQIGLRLLASLGAECAVIDQGRKSILNVSFKRKR